MYLTLHLSGNNNKLSEMIKSFRARCLETGPYKDIQRKNKTPRRSTSVCPRPSQASEKTVECSGRPIQREHDDRHG